MAHTGREKRFARCNKQGQPEPHYALQSVLPVDWQSIEAPSEEVYSELVASMIVPRAGSLEIDGEHGCDEIFDNIFTHWTASTPALEA